MDKNMSASASNSNSLNDYMENKDHTSNYIEAMYKLMAYSLERNEPREGHALRRVSAVSFGEPFGEPTISPNMNSANGSELWAQQLGTTRYALMHAPPVAPTRPKVEKRHTKSAAKKHRKTLLNGIQRELLDEASVDEDNNGNTNDYHVFKCKPHRRLGTVEDKTLPVIKPKIVREPEVIFYDSTAEKGTQTKAV